MTGNQQIWTGQEAWEAICALKHMRARMNPFEFHAWAVSSFPDVVASRYFHRFRGRILIELGILALLLPFFTYAYAPLRFLSSSGWVVGLAFIAWVVLWVKGSLRLNDAWLLKHLEKGLLYFYPTLENR